MRLEAGCYDPPFHVRAACGGRDAVGALEALEQTERTMEEALEKARGFGSGRTLAVALRVLFGELLGLTMEVRGRLTGVWPTPGPLESGQAVLVAAAAVGRTGEPLLAEVVQVVERRGDVRADLLVTARDGAGRERVRLGRERWEGRVAPAAGGWPGGDGMGDVRPDDEDLVWIRRQWRAEEEEGGVGGRMGRMEREEGSKKRRVGGMR